MIRLLGFKVFEERKKNVGGWGKRMFFG
jgi:hypothetical protein